MSQIHKNCFSSATNKPTKPATIKCNAIPSDSCKRKRAKRQQHYSRFCNSVNIFQCSSHQCNSSNSSSSNNSSSNSNNRLSTIRPVTTSSVMLLFSTLLAGIILGCDLALSDAEFLQQHTSTEPTLTPAVTTRTPSASPLTKTTTTTTTQTPAAATTIRTIATTSRKIRTANSDGNQTGATPTPTTASATSLTSTHTTISTVNATATTTTIPTTTTIVASSITSHHNAFVGFYDLASVQATNIDLIDSNEHTNSDTTTLQQHSQQPQQQQHQLLENLNISNPLDVDSNTLDSLSIAEDDDNDNETLEQPPAESLTKGFLIPTFLPPFPAFAMADLHSYTTAAPSTTTTPVAPTLNAIQLHQQQLYLAGFKQMQEQTARTNLTLPATNVSVQVGSHAYLPCHIRRLNKSLSWVRLRDGHILSVDQTTFIADQRFQSIFKGDQEHTWSLQIKYVQSNDDGWYECQVSTEPKLSAKVFLSVVVPRTELIGDQNRFVKAGSKVALHCIVRGTLDPPTYIIWFRGKSQVIDDNKLGWFTQIDRNIFGNVSDNQNTIGSLIIPFVRKKDSGNYTCQPSNSEAVSVDLHVLSGEYSASAIMSSAESYHHHCPNYNFFNILLLLLWASPWNA